MANLITAVKKSWEFVSHSMWHIRIDKVNKRQGFFIKQLRIFSLAIQGFNEDKCLTKASALTFYTLFSIVPILALIFAIAKGFGYDAHLKNQIANNYQDYSSVLNHAFVYADSLLSTTKGGIIAGFGTVLLLWSVMKLLVSIEGSFNEIWEIKKGRSWIRKITDYLTIMLVSPIFLIVAGGLNVAISTKIGSISFLGSFSIVLIQLVAFIMLISVFTFIYIVLPNTKVNFKSAASAAIIAALLFEILQWAYIKFQIGANHLNAIYGGFAALPLFLIWVQYSWYIVLFGAEIAFANQNVDHYELENEIKNLSTRYKKAIALMIANLVSKRFYNNEPSLTDMQIAETLDLPVRLSRNIINEFVETKIFVEVNKEEHKEIVYQPGVTESKFTVKFIFDSLDNRGINSLPINDTKEFEHVKELMKKIDESNDNDLGKLLVKDLVK